jgi:hypothetical protein
MLYTPNTNTNTVIDNLSLLLAQKTSLANKSNVQNNRSWPTLMYDNMVQSINMDMLNSNLLTASEKTIIKANVAYLQNIWSTSI